MTDDELKVLIEFAKMRKNLDDESFLTIFKNFNGNSDIVDEFLSTFAIE